MAFQVFTDTSFGMPKNLRDKYHIDYFQMRIIVNEKEYPGDLDYKAYARKKCMVGWM